jgi:hypothetical protein
MRGNEPAIQGEDGDHRVMVQRRHADEGEEREQRAVGF